jgi:hypothetical protein
LKMIDASSREEPVEADEDQTVCTLQPGANRRRPLQDDEFLPQVEDFGLTPSDATTPTKL